MAVTPSTTPLTDIKQALELLMGVMLAALTADDMIANQRAHAVAGQLSVLLEWAIGAYPPGQP